MQSNTVQYKDSDSPTRRNSAQRCSVLINGSSVSFRRGREAAAAGAAAARRTIDLEGLAFAQGGHFMANKTCQLPPVSGHWTYCTALYCTVLNRTVLYCK